LSFGSRKGTPHHRKRSFDHLNEEICPAFHVDQRRTMLCKSADSACSASK
jgi:hypothetical protein